MPTEDGFLRIKVNKYSLTPNWFIAGTKGSYGFEQLELVFGKEWDELAKLVTFFPKSLPPVTVIYNDEPILIPNEVTSVSGSGKFIVSGVNEASTLISVTGTYTVLDTESPGGDEAVTPTPSELSQVLTIMQRVLDISEAALKNVSRDNNFVTKNYVDDAIANSPSEISE